MSFRNPITSLPASAITGQLSGSQIAPGAIGSTQIAPGSITTPLLAANAITGQTITGGTINGAVYNGTNYVQNSSGIFAYSGPPAAQNLIGSIAAQAGTDAYGNDYPAGVSSLSGGAGAVAISNLFNGVIYAGFAANAGAQIDYTHAGFFETTSPGFSELQASGQAGKAAVAQLFGVGSTSGGPSANSPTWQIQAGGSATVYGSIVGALVGGDAVNGTATWQIPAYSTGWADSTVFNGQSGQMKLRFRRTNEDGVRVVGTATASTGATGTVFVLPTGFRPLLGNCMISSMQYDPTSGKVITAMARIDGSGNVVFSTADGFAATVAGSQVWIDGLVQIGNIP